MKIIIEEWDGGGAIRIPDEALQELELDVGDAVYLIEEFVGNTRCLVLSKKPQIADRIDELTEAWDSGRLGEPRKNEAATMHFSNQSNHVRFEQLTYIHPRLQLRGQQVQTSHLAMQKHYIHRWRVPEVAVGT